jgi:hypothetical protein
LRKRSSLLFSLKEDRRRVNDRTAAGRNRGAVIVLAVIALAADHL